ncbi:calumenin-B-like isoform X2 [Apostichopus japonicus]|uniref:calumenin-B-like isoform X2 n=1 Tax=Stichopus japonicus TaxID=307972 RepID=UPI003AB8A2CE
MCIRPVGIKIDRSSWIFRISIRSSGEKSAFSQYSYRLLLTMDYFRSAITLAFILTSLVNTVFTKATLDHGARVHNPEKLSSQEHFDGHNEHNAAYDHDAFLGENEARQFEHLTPQQSRGRLGKIVDKIDKNGDGFVSDMELKDQIHHNQNRYMYRDADRLWKGQNQNGDSKITWHEYNQTTYSGMSEEDLVKTYTGQDFVKRLRRDRARWKLADIDRTGDLNQEEYTAFLHPEGFDHMKDLVAEETLEDMDKDKDGLVSLEEFISDLLAREDPDGPEPEWLANERNYFMVARDQNGDGKLNLSEVREYIFPTDHDPAEAEMKHLLYEADEDKDGLLTKQEIVNKYDLFAGSQATDFGQAIKDHDEF